jgi:hypothetical protein
MKFVTPIIIVIGPVERIATACREISVIREFA